MERLEKSIVAEERQAGERDGFAYGEPLKLLTSSQLHINTDSWHL
jgi:hypothetical protein